MFKKIIRTLLCAPLVLVASAASAFEYYSVTQGTPVYSAPENNQTVTELLAGQMVLQIDQRGAWSQVFFLSPEKQPLKGWLLTRLIDPVASNQTAGATSGGQTGSYMASVDNLRLRSGPGTEFEVVGQLNKQQQVQVVRREAGWFRVQYRATSGSNREAWVLGKYLQVSGAAAQPFVKTGRYRVNGSKVNFRAGPATSYAVVGQLSNSQVVEVIEVAQGWMKISYDLLGQQVTGWMSDSFLERL